MMNFESMYKSLAYIHLKSELAYLRDVTFWKIVSAIGWGLLSLLVVANLA